MLKERYEFLDWLRVIAIFVLLFFHTGMLFVGWGWHITNAETIPALQMPMDLAHRLRRTTGLPVARVPVPTRAQHNARGFLTRREHCDASVMRAA